MKKVKRKPGRPPGAKNKTAKVKTETFEKVNVSNTEETTSHGLQNSESVKAKLTGELKEVATASDTNNVLTPGNDLEQRLNAEANAENITPGTETPNVETEIPGTELDEDQPKRRGRKPGSKKGYQPPEHNEDVIGVMLEGSVIPAIAWKAKVDITDLMDTEREKQMLMNIMPEDSPLRRRSWGIYIVVRGCLLIGKTLRAKLKQKMGKEKYEKIFGANGEVNIPQTENPAE